MEEAAGKVVKGWLDLHSDQRGEEGEESRLRERGLGWQDGEG